MDPFELLFKINIYSFVFRDKTLLEKEYINIFQVMYFSCKVTASVKVISCLLGNLSLCL